MDAYIDNDNATGAVVIIYKHFCCKDDRKKNLFNLRISWFIVKHQDKHFTSVARITFLLSTIYSSTFTSVVYENISRHNCDVVSDVYLQTECNNHHHSFVPITERHRNIHERNYLVSVAKYHGSQQFTIFKIIFKLVLVIN